MRNLFILLALLSGLTASGQTYFSQRYALSPVYTLATDVVLEPGGGYVVAGQAADSLGQPGEDIYLLWLDAAGQMTRNRFYNQPNATLFTGGIGGSLLRTHNGGLAVTGSATDLSTQLLAGKLWRFNARGDTLWTRFYRASTNLIIYNGIELADGGFALVGLLAHADPNATDLLVIRTDSLGYPLWQRTYDLFFAESAQHIIATPDGGFVFSGSGANDLTSTPFNRDGLVYKIDSLGAMQWQHVFGGRYSDAAGPLVETPDGGYLLSGSWTDHVLSGAYSQAKPTLLKFDRGGQFQWQRSYGPGRFITGTLALYPLADGGYVLAGQTTDPTNATPQGNGFSEAFMLRVCADGDSVWYRTYKLLAGGRSQNYLRDLKPMPDGGFVAAGWATPRTPDTGTQDAWVFKVDSAGYLQPGGTPPTLHCRPITGSSAENLDQTAVTLSPNPTPDGHLTLELTGHPQAARVEVLDAIGRVVFTALLATRHSPLDLSRLPTGLYVVRVQTEHGLVVRRLVRQ